MVETKSQFMIPDAVHNVAMGDIPWKYFQPTIQYSTFGLSIDADFCDFRKALNLIKTVKESDGDSYR